MELVQANEDKVLSEEKYYFIYETFYTNLIVTTKKKSRAEIQNIKKEEIEKNIENQPGSLESSKQNKF